MEYKIACCVHGYTLFIVRFGKQLWAEYSHVRLGGCCRQVCCACDGTEN